MNKTEKNTYFVAEQGETYFREIKAKNLRGAKAIASRMYQKCNGGKFSIYQKITGYEEFELASSWIGRDTWGWVDSQ